MRSVPGVRWHGIVRMLEDLTDERENIRVLIDPFETDVTMTEFR